MMTMDIVGPLVSARIIFFFSYKNLGYFVKEQMKQTKIRLCISLLLKLCSLLFLVMSRSLTYVYDLLNYLSCKFKHFSDPNYVPISTRSYMYQVYFVI